MTIALTYMKSCSIHLFSPRAFAPAYLWAKVCVCGEGGGGGGGGSWVNKYITAMHIQHVALWGTTVLCKLVVHVQS